MGNNRNPRIKFNCDYCKEISDDIPSHYKRKKRHFCNQACYSNFRRELLPKEEQHSFGSGHTPEERAKRFKARGDLNHAIRDGKLERKPCEKCGEKSEAHHPDYDKPLEVQWLCFKHHRELHKLIHENPELLTNK